LYCIIYAEINNVDNTAHERIQAINEEIKNLRDNIKLMRVSKSGEISGRNRVKVGPCVEKDFIVALKKEREDLKPVALAVKHANKMKSKDELDELERERRQVINVLRNRAIAGYADERTRKQVPPLYNLNADEIGAQHQTERSRAMKDKTQLRFQTFKGEGRSFVRVHSHRENEEIFEEQFMPQIHILQARRKAARGNKEAIKSVTGQITDLERKANEVAPLIVGQTEEETFGGESTLFKLDPVKLSRDVQNPTIWDKTVPRAERRRRMQTVARLRIQSDEKRNPVWVEIPVVLHRPFPCGAKILSAAVNREKIGSNFRWNVEFTVSYEEAVQETVGKGIVAGDLGWAQESLPQADGRIRVAGVLVRDAKSNETFSEFCLPSSFYEYQQKLNDIHAIRDMKTNEAFAAIDAFRSTNDIVNEALRTLLDEAKRSLAARKSANREPPVYHLRRAVWMFRNEEVKSDLALRDILEVWYKRWNHLNEWLTNGRDNLLEQKRDYYRRWAHDLAQRNGLLLLDADNFAKMAKTPEAEEDRKTTKGGLRQAASPAMLRSALTAAFAQTLWATIASSRTCRQCLHVNEKLGAGRTFECANCGHKADREENATGNIIDAYLRTPGQFSSSKKVSQTLTEKKEAESLEIAEATKGLDASRVPSCGKATCIRMS
jgi:hypothetical protein